MHTLYTRINTGLLVFIALTGVALVTMLATRAYGGPLDPPGPVDSTQSMVIFQPAGCKFFPIVISTPGSYRLGGNITGCPERDGIQIASSNISLDLAGFSVMGVPGSFIGIKNVGANSQLSIADGIVVTWGGAGVDLSDSSMARIDNIIAAYNGGPGIRPGSRSAVSHSTSSANSQGIVATVGTNITISDCNVDSNGAEGISLGGAGSVVDGCEVGSNGGAGISVQGTARVTSNHVHHNGTSGISATGPCTIEGNTVEWSGSGILVMWGAGCAVVGNTAASNAGDGIKVWSDDSRVDGNHAAGNAGAGFAISEVTAGRLNIITRNSSSDNAGGNYSLGGSLDAGPIVTAGSAGASPWSNISD